MEHAASLYNEHKFKKKDVLLLQGVDNFTKQDLDALKQERESGKPEAILSICLSTTSACNIRCWYCYALANKKTNPQQLTAQEYQSLLDQAVELGARTLIVCGDGEPTYDPVLVPLVKHAVRLGLMPVVVTNGTMFGNDNACRAKHGMSGKGLAQFLFDHHASLLVKLETLDPQLYEDTVKAKNAWRWFVRGVNHLAATGFGSTWQESMGRFTRLSFTGIATRDNIEEIPHLLAWARSQGAQYICKVPSPTGGALDAVHKLFPPDRVAEMRTRIDEYTDKRETLTPVVIDADKCMTCLVSCSVDNWHMSCIPFRYLCKGRYRDGNGTAEG